MQIFVGVQFDVRGIVQTGSTTRDGEPYPKEVTGIAVHQKTQRLHFLHAGLARPCAQGTTIGYYLLHYANGGQQQIPIVIGQDVAHWRIRKDEEASKLNVVWVDPDEERRKEFRAPRLFKTTWTNPMPNLEITKIDLVCTR